MREGGMRNSTTTTGIGVEDFAAVYDRHRSRVYAQCLRRLRSPADADDATQVTFLRAFTAMNRGSGPRRVGPWLATIARNECSDRLSSAGRAVPMDMAELPLADDGPAPDEGVLAESEGAEVRAALEQLPFAQRSVLHLREVCELSYAEVAERLAIPVTAVETLLFRARNNLREEVLALRSPLKCHRARQLGEAVRDGGPVSSLERKALRNHRSECALCSWLPVRRARGARAAAVLVVTAAAATARRLVVAPVADALVSAGAPAKTAAVAVAAGGVAAGGLAVDRPRPASTPERPAAQVREATPAPKRSAPTPAASAASGPVPPRARARRGPRPPTPPGPSRSPRGGPGGLPPPRPRRSARPPTSGGPGTRPRPARMAAATAMHSRDRSNSHSRSGSSRPSHASSRRPPRRRVRSVWREERRADPAPRPQAGSRALTALRLGDVYGLGALVT